MEKAISIDYGKAKVGVAISTGSLATPYKVIRYGNLDELLVRLKKISDEMLPDKIVVGVSSGKIAEESKDFGKKLENYLNIPVVFVDEHLTTKEVQLMTLDSGMKRKKRKSMEDAFAAALILQNYIDSR